VSARRYSLYCEARVTALAQLAPRRIQQRIFKRLAAPPFDYMTLHTASPLDT
jgi:hypothetical protein